MRQGGELQGCSEFGVRNWRGPDGVRNSPARLVPAYVEPLQILAREGRSAHSSDEPHGKRRGRQTAKSLVAMQTCPKCGEKIETGVDACPKCDARAVSDPLWPGRKRIRCAEGPAHPRPVAHPIQYGPDCLSVAIFNAPAAHRLDARRPGRVVAAPPGQVSPPHWVPVVHQDQLRPGTGAFRGCSFHARIWRLVIEKGRG
jgi:ribosomal protein L32